MRRQTGISTKPAQLPSLEAALRRVDPTMTATDFLLAETADGAQLLERMIDEVTINETFFFRQRPDLDAIDWPSLVARARASGSPHARVWVPPPLRARRHTPWRFSPARPSHQTRRRFSFMPPTSQPPCSPSARAGRYGGRSARLLDRAPASRYFTQDGPDVVVGEQLRQIVRFSRQNLTGHFIPAAGGPFDLIACRNVLIYFDPERGRAGGRRPDAGPGPTRHPAARRRRSLVLLSSELLRLGTAIAQRQPPSGASPAPCDPAPPRARARRSRHPAGPAAASAVVSER